VPPTPLVALQRLPALGEIADERARYAVLRARGAAARHPRVEHALEAGVAQEVAEADGEGAGTAEHVERFLGGVRGRWKVVNVLMTRQRRGRDGNK
jgi:hypothetical protein